MSTFEFKRASVAVLALIAAAGIAGLAAPAAVAAPSHTRYVATTGDDTDNDCTNASNPCLTIQNGVDQADPGDTVSVAAGTYHESVRVRKSLSLVGAGSTGSSRTTIAGASADPSIWVDGTDTDTPPDVTIRNFDVSGNAHDDGIYIEDATATIESCFVSGNEHDGVQLDTAREDASTAKAAQVDDTVPSATISGDTITDNVGEGVEVDAGAAAIDHSSVSRNGDGGVIAESGSATIDTSTLDANFGAGVVSDGDGNDVTLTKSTVSHTHPFSSSSSVDAFGAGVIVFPGGVATLDTSTVYGNTGQGVLSFAGITTIKNSTITQTKRPAGEDGGSGGAQDFPYGGIAVITDVTNLRGAALAYTPGIKHASGVHRDAVVAPSVRVIGTIDSGNTTLEDCNGPVTDQGYNLAGDDTCDFSATGSKNSGHALLGPLQNNGGPTKTAKPAKHSDAIDKIPTGSANCATTASDQRGVSRPQGPKCDKGAVEDAQPPIVFHPNALPNGTVGTAYHATITATGGLGAPYTFALVGGSLPPGLSFDDGVISGTPSAGGTFHITVSVDDPTLHHYTIVIIGPSTEPIANTGAHVRPLANLGVWSVVFGIMLLLGASWTARWARRYRRAH